MKVSISSMMLLLVCGGSVACGQVLVTPLPEVPAPLPEFVPPAPVAKAPESEAKQEPISPPVFWTTDAEGRLKGLTMPPELSAITMIPMTEEQKVALDQMLGSRRAQLEAAVAKNYGAAAALSRVVSTIGSVENLNELIAVSEPMRALSIAPTLDSAIRSLPGLRQNQLDAYSGSLRAYRAALTDGNTKLAGGDTNKLMVISARSEILNRSMEPLAGLRGILANVAKDWASIKSGMTLSENAERAEGEKLLAEATTDDQRARAAAKILGSMNAEEQGLALKRYAGEAKPTLPAPAGDVGGTK